MTYPPPTPPPQQGAGTLPLATWVGAPPPAGVTAERHARPKARFGKIGFWLLVLSFLIAIGQLVVERAMVSAALDAAGMLLSSDPEFAKIHRVNGAIGHARTLVLVAATVLGIVGLMLRERQIGWSILSAAAFIVHFGIYIMGWVIFGVVTVVGLAIT